jgi:hypothetical protein
MFPRRSPMSQADAYSRRRLLPYEVGAAFGLRAIAGRTVVPASGLPDFPQTRETGSANNPPGAEYGGLAPAFVGAGHVRSRLWRGQGRVLRRHTYQVNLTFRLQGTFSGDPAALFSDLVDNQQGATPRTSMPDPELSASRRQNCCLPWRRAG